MRQFKIVAEQSKKIFEEELNKLSEDGWEIIHYGSSVSIGSTRSNTVVLFSAVLEKEKAVSIKKKTKTDKRKSSTVARKTTENSISSTNDFQLN